MAKYHVNAKGEPGTCRARKHCPFGDIETDHFENPEEARRAFEDSMRHATFLSEPTPTTVTTDDLLRMDRDSQLRTMGAVWRVIRESQWNEIATSYWQAAYDSSKAGALWLERKRNEKYRGTDNPEYLQRSAALERFRAEQEDNPMPLDLPDDPGHVFKTEFSTEEPEAFPEDDATTDQKIKLALLSAAWMRSLTPEETEAVSWVTSNGASVLNGHINGTEHRIWGHDVYSEKFLNQTLRNFRSAMAKAPELEEPVIIYRGTSADRADWTELDRPASSTISGSRASSFRGNNDDGTRNDSPAVLIEIKTRKVASVAGMGVHGVAEAEVLAPLGRYKKVGDFETLRGREGKRWGDRPAIDPDFDKIRVIQLEYLGD